MTAEKLIKELQKLPSQCVILQASDAEGNEINEVNYLAVAARRNKQPVAATLWPLHR